MALDQIICYVLCEFGPVAQLARAFGLHPKGHRFESGQVHQPKKGDLLKGSSQSIACYYP